jgi:catecholate siderophore receptor
VRRFVVLATLLFVLPAAARAQTQANVHGTVLDPSRAPIVGARVVARAANTTISTVSDAEGKFSLWLEPGPYTVTVTATGFEQLARPTAAPASGAASIEFVLELGVIHEAVNVGADSGYTASLTTTATKTSTPLRDVPQAVTVITREVIADQDMRAIADVVRYVPGVGTAQGEGNRDTPILRGNSTTADFFVDGVRDDVQYFRDLYNTERVEALKGPNAMVFGRGGAGGVINRSTLQANWSRAGQVNLQFGSHDNRRATFDLGRPLSRALAARLTGMYENSGSYRDGVRLERYGFNPTAAYLLGNETTIRLGYERFHDDRTADRGIPSSGNRPFATGESTFFGDPHLSNTSVTVNSVTAVIDRRLSSGLLLKNRTHYAGYDKFYQNVYPSGPVTGTTAALGAYNNSTERHNLFNQTDMNFSAEVGRTTHVLAAGAEIGRQVTDNLRETGYFTGVGPDITTLAVPAAAPTVSVPVAFRPGATDANNHGVATVAAVYAQDQVEISRHLQAVAGLRYDRFAVDFHNNRSGADLTSVDNLVSPRFGVIYKPLEAVSVYANYSLTFVPRAGEQLSSLSLTNQALDPEKFTNYEVGSKWDMAGGLSLTAAIYRLDRTNVVIPDPVDPTRSILVDGQRTKGVELGVGGRITQSWSTVGGYAYQDGAITRTLSPSAVTGAVLAQLPAHTFSLWNRYDIQPRVGVGVGVIHRSDMFTSTDNIVVLPAATRIDGAVFVTLTRRLRAQINVENLLNDPYYASANGNNNITPGSPRAVRMTLSARF